MSQLMAARKSSFLTYLRLTWQMTKLSVLSAFEYRGNFLLQVFGMVINDAGLIIIWVIFFHQIPQINGWQFKDQALMFAVSTASYGLLMVFSGGIDSFARVITKGLLDYYLAMPKNILWHVAAARTMVAALGDLIFGLGMLIISGYTAPTEIIIFVLFVIISAFIMFNFLVAVHSLAFFFGNMEETADRAFFILLGFTHYPGSVFSGGLKLLMLTLLPAFYIAFLPVETIKNFSFLPLMWLSGFAIISFVIAITIFKLGLKRYESGNLMNLRI